MEQISRHIVFLTPGFASSEQDTTAIPALQVYFKKMAQAVLPNTKLTIIAFQYPFTKEKYRWNSFDLIPLNGRNNKLRKVFIWQKAINTLKQLNKENQISAIHSFWIGECSFVGQRFASKNNIPHIVTAMGQDVNLKNKFAQFINPDKTKVVSLSQIQQKLLVQHYNLNSKVIPWDLDQDSFPDLADVTIDILGVGSLNEVKNFDFFIDVIHELTQLKYVVKAEIIGNGSQYQSLKQKIKQLKLEDTITLTGEIPRDEVLLKMAQSKLLLHTSRHEGYGYVFAEALYSGMRLVSFNVGAATASEYWKIVDSKAAMVLAVEAFLNPPQNQRTRIQLSQEETLTAYLKLYVEKTN